MPAPPFAADLKATFERLFASYSDAMAEHGGGASLAADAWIFSCARDYLDWLNGEAENDRMYLHYLEAKLSLWRHALASCDASGRPFLPAEVQGRFDEELLAFERQVDEHAIDYHPEPMRSLIRFSVGLPPHTGGA